MTSLRGKLWIGFGGLLLILSVVSVMTIAVLTRYSHALERVFRENYDSAVYCDGMRDALDELNAHAERVLWQEAPVDSGLVSRERADFAEYLRRQLGNCSLPGETDLTQRIASLWGEYQGAYDTFLSGRDGRQQTYEREILPRYQELKTLTRRISVMNMSNMVSVDGKVKRTLLSVRNVLLVLIAAGVFLASALVAAIGPGVLKPLRALTRSAEQIEAGNLDLIIESRSRDEVGQLTEAFNSMARRLREFRLRDENRLLRTQQTTQLAIDSLPDGVFVVGPDAVVEIANRTARVLLGIEPGATVQSLPLAWARELYARVIEKRKPVEPDGYRSLVQVFDEGAERFLVPRAVPMLDASAGLIGVTLILADVTGLRHADEAKSNLLATVSHELRTPLTSLRMALLMLQGDEFGFASPRQKTLLSAAAGDAERLFRTIENLLNMSRIESGRTQFEFRRTSVRELVLSTVEPLRAGFAQKGLRLEVAVPENAPEVIADPNYAGVVIANLLSNAMKFTPAGGTVLLSIEAGEGRVTFAISDTGPGIPEQYAGRIFEKFFRVPRTEGPAGAGLGLAIAKEIVDAHDGRLEFRRRPEGGSLFCFTLPIAPARHAAQEPITSHA